jgi:hypothetical protein
MQDRSPPRPKAEVIQALLKVALGSSALDVTQVIAGSGGAVPPSGPDNWNLARLPVLAIQGRSLEALSLCHLIARASNTSDAVIADLTELQKHLEDELLCQQIELVTEEARIRPLALSEILIGRPSATRPVDIAINCGWFSRGERGILLSRRAEEWVVADQGGANGSYVGDKVLAPGNPYSLPQGHTTVEIGRSEERRAPIVLSFERFPEGEIAIGVGVGAGFDRAGTTTWPSIEEDIRMRWIAFQSSFSLGMNALSAFAGLQSDQRITVSFVRGYWITPEPNEQIQLNGIAFSNPVPLPANSVISVRNLHMRVEPVLLT